MTQSQLSESVKILPSMLNLWENDGDTPGRNHTLEIIHALHQQGGIQTLDEANVLLSAAQYEGLNTNETATIDSAWLSREIRRPIDFPPKYKQAGISILSYFSEVVSQKYPDLAVGVTIEQIGTTVTLIVTTAEGEKERIEQELTNYGLVIQGKLPPEEYVHDPMEVMALRNKLEMAALELRQTERLMETEHRHFNVRIVSLEQQVQWMGMLLEKDRTAHAELLNAFEDLSRQSTATTEQSFGTILKVLERGITAEDKEEILWALTSIQRHDKSLFYQVSKLITIGAIQGAAGNYLYQFLQHLSIKLP